ILIAAPTTLAACPEGGKLACVMQWVQCDISHASRPGGTAAFHGSAWSDEQCGTGPFGREPFLIRRGRAFRGPLACSCAPSLPSPAGGEGRERAVAGTNPATTPVKAIVNDATKGGIMSEHDESRRAFIVGAVGAGAAASTALVQTAYAKTEKAKTPTTKSPATAEAPAADRAVETFDGHGVFFNDEHAATVAAFAERLMPGAPGKPGAHDANVINYIDLALAGAYADQQDFY